jgi:hypothetical protein
VDLNSYRNNPDFADSGHKNIDVCLVHTFSLPPDEC